MSKTPIELEFNMDGLKSFGLSLNEATEGVAFFFKQWGNWISPVHYALSRPVGNVYHIAKERHQFPDGTEVCRVSKKAAGRSFGGCEYSAFPSI